MISIGSKIKVLGGMVGTDDLNERETEFVSDMVDQTQDGKQTTMLTFAQVQWIEGLHRKHFA